jgi:hypothetical protein
MNREKVYLFSGCLLDEDGEPSMPIPHLFHNVAEAQKWLDIHEWDLEVVKAIRKGDVLVAA